MGYHEALRDEMQKSLKPRTKCSVFETLHMTHVVKQCLLGVLTGSQRDAGDKGAGWTRQILATDERISALHRCEIQDGKRKAPTQKKKESTRAKKEAPTRKRRATTRKKKKAATEEDEDEDEALDCEISKSDDDDDMGEEGADDDEP